MNSSGSTILAGVVGWPVEHSLSPRLHGFWLDQLGIDGEYHALAVAPGDLERELRALHAKGYRGVNLTVPHKEAGLAIADEVDPWAKAVGAVNTLVFHENGRIGASNTDGFGFIENIRAGAPGLDLRLGPAIVIGAGGAARAVAAAMLDAGVRSVRLINRTRARADALSATLSSAFNGAYNGLVQVADWERRAEAISDGFLLVNTTTLGMTGQPPLDLPLDALPKHAVVNDIVYAPLETPLLAAARARGNPTVDGLGMLLHQARPGFEAWFGVRPEVTPALRAHVLAAMAAKA